MQHFRNRDDLVEWLAAQPMRKAIARAFQEGTVEVVGGFYMIPPSYPGGWIVKVTSIYKRTWILAIIPMQNTYKIHIIENIPWQHWSGANTTNPLYAGDHPEEYRGLKNGNT